MIGLQRMPTLKNNKIMIQSLPINLSWGKADTHTLLPILFSLVLFEIYWFTAQSDKIKAFFYKKSEFDKASVNHITFIKIFGFIIMGLFSALLCLIFLPDYSLIDYGLTYNPETILFTFAWTFGLALLAFPLAYFSSRRQITLVNYPQIRARIWTKKIVLMNGLGWILYLLGYEFLFRGVLLFPLAQNLGVWKAIVINIALCSATKISKGFDEAIGAIILSLVLCLLTLASGTIWIAFLVHLTLAWTVSFSAVRHHPDMHYMISKK